MSSLLERLGLERPIVQAGMGGGLAGYELAAAVSGAGGLGTIGILPASGLRRSLEAARERAEGKPIAVNLLLPFARRAHLEAAKHADAVVTFWGRPRRPPTGFWIHQCGSVEEARAARAAGADAVIAQGVEAGGHVRGTTPVLELLEQTRAAVGPEYPVLAAGGMADAVDVHTALEAGADAAVLGTRFLMTPESGALDAYKQRLVESDETVLTELFGAGWPRAPHRVLFNEATRRWLADDRRGPRWVRALNAALSPALRRVPLERQGALARAQRADRPLLGPFAVVAGAPDLLEAGPLYAGESVARIHDLRPAGELVAQLSGNAPTSTQRT
jgi:nitronate monooxygenase